MENDVICWESTNALRKEETFEVSPGCESILSGLNRGVQSLSGEAS